jgi:hypothetical protein
MEKAQNIQEFFVGNGPGDICITTNVFTGFC